jgi:two-component system, OmpR family, copper resistance phosphate regulon response regulator CusR
VRILLIEDEPSIAAVVKRGLEEARYAVDVAPDGATGLDLALSRTYGVILLDLMLPRVDGWQVCERLRARRITAPILMLTARDAVQDRVRGLEIGADDYLAKPFDFDELLARIRALLRRESIHKTRVIRIADLEIDTGLRQVTRGGQAVPLTPREYSLLEALAAREGQILTREVIMDHVWMDEESYSNIVDVHIRALRKKIDADFAVKLIQTVHRMGYMLKRPDAEEAA